MEEEKLTWAGIMQGFEESKKLIDEAAAFTREAVSELKASLAKSKVDFEKRQAEYEKKRLEDEKKRQADEKKRQADEKKRQADEKKRQAEYEKKRLEDEKRRQAEYEKRQAEYEKRSAELDARIAATSAEVAGIGASNGMFAEDVYYRALSRQKTFAGIHFDDVSDQFGGILKLPGGVRLQDQFDIVMLNDIAAAIIESKYRAREDDVEKLVEKKASNFKTLFPAYKDFKIYLGLGALAFEDKAVKKARECGVGLLKRVGDTIEYAADWEVKAY